MMKSSDGEGDLMAGVAKVKLVARLQKIPDLASFMPLFLEENDLALYFQLSEDQLDSDKIEAKFKMVFMEGAFFCCKQAWRR